MNKRKILQSAQKHLQKGALDKALKDYQTLLKADPKDVNIRLKIGDIHLKQGTTEEALGSYLKVADRFMSDGFDAKAVALYKQIVRIDPKRLDVYPLLAELYQRLGLNSDAMGALQTAADAHYRDGSRDDALDLLRRMAALDPTNTANRMKVAELLRKEERNEEAADEFRAVADELGRQSDQEGRIVALERLVELEPETLEARATLARARIGAGRLLEAEECARDLVERDDTELVHHELLAESLEKAGKESEAAISWIRVAELARLAGDESRARDLMQRFGDASEIGGDSDEPVLDQTDELAFGAVEGEGDLGLETDEFSDPGYVGDQGMKIGAPLGEEASEDDLPSDPSLPPVDAAPLETIADAASEEAESPPAASREVEPLEGDPDQLIAEASVLLRYGKTDRALETLRGVVAANPEHPAALEKLHEALEKAGDTEEAAAIQTRLDALPGASEASAPTPIEADATIAGQPPEIEIDEDEDLFDEIDVEVSDESSGDAVAEDAAGSDIEPAADSDEGVDLDLGESATMLGLDVNDPGASVDAPGAPELDLDLDLGLEDDAGVAADAGEADLDLDEEPAATDALDLGSDAPGAADAAADAAALDLDLDAPGEADETDEPADPPVLETLDVPDDVAAGLDADIGVDLGASDDAGLGLESEISEDEDEAAEAGEAGEAESAEAASDPAVADLDLDLNVDFPDPEAPEEEAAEGATSSGSSTTPQQMVEDLEEADFYFQQGLLNEARESYQRIVAVAPNHPQALLRLGEIEAQIGPAAEDAPASPPLADETRVADAGVEASEDFFSDASYEPLETPAAEAGDPDASGFSLDTTADLDEAVLDLDPESAEPATPSDAAGADGDELASSETDDVASDAGEEDSYAETIAADGPLVDEAPALDDELDGEPDDEPAVEPQAAAGASDAEQDAEAADAGADEEEPDSDSDSFDLASELADALDDGDPGDTQSRSGSTEEEGFEQVFAAFKEGVDRELGEGDHEAHYDLGIAYKEMGLFDDAIEQFGRALESSDRRLACLHMMGLCALDMGRVTDATANLEQALAMPDLPEDQQVAIRFDLGRAYAEGADVDRARAAFEAVIASNPDFGNASERLEALADIEVEDSEPAEPAEAFESFDDLLDETDADEAEASAAPEYESFDDLMGEDSEDESEGAEPALEATPLDAETDSAEAAAAIVDPADELEAEDPLVADAAEADESTDAAEEAAVEAPAEAEPDPDPNENTATRKRARKKISFV